MILLIKNAFLIRLDLMFFMPLWKVFQLLQILNDLSTKHLIEVILYENNVKLLEFTNRFVICLKCEILIIHTWNE